MAEKLSWTELRRLLAARAGVSEKEAGAFLNAFNAQLLEALKQDKQVKINGLGTFRLQAVAPRRSVNVSTGEEMVIEGYNKLSFTPEAGVKELMERRPAVGEPAEEPVVAAQAVDPLKKLGEQAEEIVGILGELAEMKPSEPEEEPKQQEEPVEEKPKKPRKSKKKAEAEVPAEPEKTEVSEVSKVSEVSEVQEVSEVPEVPEDKPKKYHFVRDTLICVVILLMLLLVGYFFLRKQLTNWIETLGEKSPIEYRAPQAKPAAAKPSAVLPSFEAEEAETEEVEVIEEVEEPVVLTPQAQSYKKLLATEYITEGSRLTWIAKKYYGDKAYWPYLYDANKDQIPNPNHIAIGTPVRVPKLTKEQLDLTNEQTRTNLEALEREARIAGGERVKD